MLSDFKDRVFFAPASNRVIDYIKEYCAPFAFEPKIELAPNMETAIFAVQNNLGVVAGDIWYREISNQSFRYIDIDSEEDKARASGGMEMPPFIFAFVPIWWEDDLKGTGRTAEEGPNYRYLKPMFQIASLFLGDIAESDNFTQYHGYITMR